MGSHSIIALDVSKSRTGVAIGEPGAPPTFLSIDCRDETTAGAVVKLGRWLIRATRESAVCALYYEAMLNPGAFMGEWNSDKGKIELGTNPITTIALAKMCGVVEFVADMRSIPCVDANLFTIRKSFLGHPRPPQPKERAKALCELIGWRPANLDEADAAVVFYWAAAKEDPKRALIVTPMEQMRAASMFPSVDAKLRVKPPKKPLPTRRGADGNEHLSAADARQLFAAKRRGER